MTLRLTTAGESHGPALVAWHNRMARTPGTAPYIVGSIDPDPAAWKP